MFRLSLLICCSLLALFVGACSRPAPEATLEGFFKDLREGRIEEAWQRGSFGFQSALGYKRFESNVRDVGFTLGGDLQVTGTNVDGRNATYEATFKAPERPLMALKVRLVDESGAWKIGDIRFTVQNEEGQPVVASFAAVGGEAKLDDGLHRKLPSDAQIKELVKKTLLDFNQALQTGDFETFHGTFSRKWQADVSPERVARAFQPFVDVKADLSGIKELEPLFLEPPRIAPDGQLVLNGYFESVPVRLVFALRFLYELPRWRLYGINCRLDRVETPDAARPAPLPDGSGVQGAPLENADSTQAPDSSGTATPQ